MTADKLQAMQIAATLTASVMVHMKVDLAPDPANGGKLGPDVFAEDLMTWEVFRIFYAAVVGAANDDTSWAPPAEAASGPKGPAAPIIAAVVKAVLPSIPGLIAGTTPVATVVAQIEAALQAAVTAAAPAPTAPAVPTLPVSK